MKRIICLITALCLVFGSFSFVFADEWGSSQISSVVNNVSSINSTLSNIYTRVNTITNYLTDSNHSVAYWTSAIASWMQPIYVALTTNLKVNLGIDQLLGGLYLITGSEASGYSYTPYLYHNQKSAAQWLADIDDRFGLKSYPVYFQNNPSSTITYYRYRNHQSNAGTYQPRDTPWGGVYYHLNALVESVVNGEVDLFAGSFTTQNVVNWGNLGTSTFTPSSLGDGIYKYLSAIQAPVARLSYVLASDERIEAQEAAAVTEQAVVDNFIDSSGSGTTSASDIGSISDLSAGYQNNFGSSASVTGIFNIFDSNNFGWFSQETANQLDTSSNNSRSKSGSEFDTPLLDQRIEDIYDALGVKP